MKKLLILIAICIPYFSIAQDNIVFKDGSEIKAKVLEISPEFVKYKKSDNLQGPDFTVYRRDVFMVQFENGTSEVLTSIDISQPLNNTQTNKRDGRRLVGSDYKSPGLAFLFSFLMPGGGQYYNKDFAKGGVMTGLWFGGLITAGTAPNYYYDDYNGKHPKDNYHYDDYYYNNVSAQRVVGNTIWVGTWIWSMIDAPIRSAAFNRKNSANATGLLEFEKEDKWVMKIEPFKSPGLGGAVTLNF